MNRPRPDIDATVRMLRDALTNKKGSDVTVYDVRGLSSITDFHVLATGMNAPHLKALGDEARLFLKAAGLPHRRQSGTPQSGWVVVDAADVVVHLFLPEPRRYYALDLLWKDAPRFSEA